MPSIRELTMTMALLCVAGCAAKPAVAPAAPEMPGASSAAPTASQVTSAASPATSTATTTSADAGARFGDQPFPRQHTIDGTKFSIHQPQADSWNGDRLTGRFAVSVATGSHTGPDGKAQDTFDYGVIHFSARTEVDKDARVVVLSDLQFGSASFPAAVDKQNAYLQRVRGLFKPGKTLTISLDQLVAALAVGAATGPGTRSLPVSNTPPEILFRVGPAVLVQVEGNVALRPAGNAGVERVINTRSLLLKQNDRYYLYLADRWLSAASLDGPWAIASHVKSALTDAMHKAVAAKTVDTLENPPEELVKAFAQGQVPDIMVRTHPAALITTQGQPEFAEIPGTHLSYVDNTGADVFVDNAQDYAWYALVSGRWFTATGSRGPWHYIAPKSLPADFRKIPADSPKSGVLVSIPGTPEAKESLIANSIPQNATVNRNEVHLDVHYDGTPQFKPIGVTPLHYAWNTPVPVIRVDVNSYYAVNQGIWFKASSATGPWVVANSVPAVIYTIPTSSPLHYVTYVRVYGSHGNVVYVGYTPGYYGTVVSNNVVVYGTGYRCNPWLGSVWYGCPATYGMGVYFGWNPWVGWTFGFGYGWRWGWYGVYSPWWGPWWGPSYPWGWWSGGAAAWNVYGHWGNLAVRGTVAAWANPWTGNYGRAGRGGYYNERTGGRGVGRAGINTNIYTGTTRARASGIRYNPQTGRVVSGSIAAAGNAYTGQAGAAFNRTAVNTNTGQVTHSAGAAGKGPNGAAGVAGFNSSGDRGDAAGVGGFHYNSNTGDLTHGGAVKVNDNVYAGRDGNVYKYDNGEWQQVTRPDPKRPSTLPAQNSDLNLDRIARDRGDQINPRNPQQVQRPQYNRPSPARQPSRQRSGFRPGLGARPAGGGFRGH